MDWFPWYPTKYESRTLHLNLEQDAIYRRLIDWYMTHEGDLSSHDQAVASICRISIEKWHEHSVVILKFFKSKNGSLKHRRCDLELSHQQNISQVRTKAAKSRNYNNNKNKDLHANAMQTSSNCYAQTNKQTDRTDRTDQPARANGHEANGHGLKNGFGLEVGRSVSFAIDLETADKLLSIAPGWDQHSLAEKYSAWQRGKESPRNPQAAFLGWAKKFTNGQRPS